LADFDLNLGMVSFLLKMTNGRTVLDTLSLVDSLDDNMWDNIVLKRDNLDVLCSGRLEPTNEVDLSPVEKILHYARRTTVPSARLSGNMEPFTLALLNQSKEIFVVCTTELPSLHFARTKAQFLRDSGYGYRGFGGNKPIAVTNPLFHRGAGKGTGTASAVFDPKRSSVC
jgi:hypothetical protein